MKISVLTALFFVHVWIPAAFGQIGSNASFSFLDLNISARNTALGGMQTSMSVDSGAVMDASLWMVNPVYSHEQLSGHVSLGYMPYYADIKYGIFNYIHDFDQYGVWAAGMQYLSYGSFESFDMAGLPQGDFSAQDYAVVVNHSHQLGVYRMGANVKLAVSQIAGYSATALLLDIGGAFVHPSQDLTVSLLFSNLGVLLSDYTTASSSGLPADVRIGLTFKPEHMPFRFNVTAHKLLQDTKAYYASDPEDMAGVAGKVLRHLTFGGEILLSPNFNVRIGYNHLIKSTLQLQQVSGGAGLSFGFMLRIKSLQMDFSRAYYHVTGGYSHVSLTANLNELIFRK